MPGKGAIPVQARSPVYTKTVTVSPTAAGSTSTTISFNKDARVLKLKAIGTVQGYVTFSIGGFSYDMPFGTNTPSEQDVNLAVGQSWTLSVYATAAGTIILTAVYQ
jgi:hypothetical protein